MCKTPNIRNDRIIGLDVLRALAIVSVVGGHFFMNTAFGRTPVDTLSMFVQNAVQYLLTTIGVPLFLMLTGYLNCTKRLTAGYFPRLARVLVSYVVISIFTYAVLLATGAELFSIKGFANGLGGFSIIRYSWYINMYIGLFLLIPAINVILDAAFNDHANCKSWLALFGGGYSAILIAFDAEPIRLHSVSRLLEELLGVGLLPLRCVDSASLARRTA